MIFLFSCFFFFSSRRRHTRCLSDWSSDVCSSDLHIERQQSPQAANLFFKIIDARARQRSTALATNIDFNAWGDYLGDPPLATAFLDRVVDGAIILKINGKSYRAHRANSPKPAPNPKS